MISNSTISNFNNKNVTFVKLSWNSRGWERVCETRLSEFMSASRMGQTHHHHHHNDYHYHHLHQKDKSSFKVWWIGVNFWNASKMFTYSLVMNRLWSDVTHHHVMIIWSPSYDDVTSSHAGDQWNATIFTDGWISRACWGGCGGRGVKSRSSTLRFYQLSHAW